MVDPKQFSKFSVTSYGGGGGVPSENIPTRIDLLRERIIALTGKMQELSMRPRMPYTQGHFPGQILFLLSDGNVEPEWDDGFPPGITSDTYEIITSIYDTIGTRKDNKLIKRPIVVKQPWIKLTSTSSEFVSSSTDTAPATSLPLYPELSLGNPQYAVGEVHAGLVYHYESDTWVETGTFERTVWPDDFETGTYTTTPPYTTETTTLETTTRYVPGTTS
jgi:hypothetical protein